MADAGRSMLAHWLEEHCGGDPLQLLQHLDVETYTGVGARATAAAYYWLEDSSSILFLFK